MSTSHPLLRVLGRTIDVLDRAGVEYAVMGGFALRWWALPRPTYDVDFAVALDDDALADLLRAFEAAGFTVDPPFLSGHVDRIRDLQKIAVALFEEGSVWPVDIFLARTPFVRSAFDRRVPADLEGRRIAVVSAEDLLLFKLLADRPKDRAEVEDLLLVCGRLDREHLEPWARRLGVADRLAKALDARDEEL